MWALPRKVHSVGVASAGLPRIVLLLQSTSTRTTNKGGSTHLQSHTEHIQIMGDLDRDAGPGASRMVEGARQCDLVRSIRPSTDKAPTHMLISLPLSLQISWRGNREILIVGPITHDWRRIRPTGQRGGRRRQELQPSQNKSGALAVGTRKWLDS